MPLEAQEPQLPAKYPMLERGESITDFMARNDGSTFVDYSNALRDHRQRLANEKGVSTDELHTGETEAVPVSAAYSGSLALEQSVEA